jgi:hypothetical protein
VFRTKGTTASLQQAHPCTRPVRSTGSPLLCPLPCLILRWAHGRFCSRRVKSRRRAATRLRGAFYPVPLGHDRTPRPACHNSIPLHPRAPLDQTEPAAQASHGRRACGADDDGTLSVHLIPEWIALPRAWPTATRSQPASPGSDQVPSRGQELEGSRNQRAGTRTGGTWAAVGR